MTIVFTFISREGETCFYALFIIRHNFANFEGWQKNVFDPDKHNHDIFNWSFVDMNNEIPSSSTSMMYVIRGLQPMAVEESLKNQPDTCSLA